LVLPILRTGFPSYAPILGIAGLVAPKISLVGAPVAVPASINSVLPLSGTKPSSDVSHSLSAPFGLSGLTKSVVKSVMALKSTAPVLKFVSVSYTLSLLSVALLLIETIFSCLSFISSGEIVVPPSVVLLL